MDKSIDELLAKFHKIKQEYESQNPKKTLTYDEVGKFINSHKFAELLAEFQCEDVNDLSKVAGRLIAISLDYADIFRNSNNSSLEELEEILQGVVKRDVKGVEYNIMEVYENKLRRDLSFPKNKQLTEEEDFILKEEIFQILAFLRTKFHAFNGRFLDSIKEKGINPNAKLLEDEKDELNALHKKYGALGKLSIEADKGRVSYSATASVSYSYARTSPEWFNNMCSYHFGDRDYDAAKRTFESTADMYEFSKVDKKRYLELFEKCWKEFDCNKMYLAVVPDAIIHKNEDLFKVRCMFMENDSSFAFRILADCMRSKGYDINSRTDKVINTENASFIELPDPIKLEKLVEEIKQRKMTV